MVNFINKIYNVKSLIIILFFSSIFAIGISSVKDFGTSNDEYTFRDNGFVNLNYLGEKFLPNYNKKFKGDKTYPKLSDYKLKFYGGAIIHTPMALFEVLIGIKDKKDQFLFKHYLYFLIFFFGLISFFCLSQNRFSNWKISLLGVLIIFLTPRIFANSFFNSFDLPFMSFIIFSMYFGICFFENPSVKNSFLFSLFSSMAIGIRIMGIIIPFLIFLIILLYILKKRDEFKKYIIPSVICILLLPLFVIIFFPHLWDEPIKNFLFTFKELANFKLVGGISNLYLGEVIMANEVPWHYIPVWILITTPIFYLLFFLIGLIKLFFINLYLKKEKNFKKFLKDIFFFLIIFLSVLAVIILNSTLYNGWRHMYFIYPSIIMMTLLGINYLFDILKKKYFVIIFQLILSLSLLHTGYWMYKNHPYQNFYFNYFAGNNIGKKFDVDYLGSSYKQNLEFLINFEKNDLLLWNTSQVKLFYPLFSLSSEDRSKIKVVDNHNDAEYLITNYYRDAHIDDKDLLSKYKLLNQVVIDNIPINSIFKKTN